MIDPRRPKRDPTPYQKKTGYWYIYFYHRGRTPRVKWVATGIQSRYFKDWRAHIPRSVHVLADQWGRLWREGGYDPWEDEKPGTVTVRKAAEIYLKERNVSPTTIETYRRTLEPFIASLTPGLSVAAVGPKHIRKYVTQPDHKSTTQEIYFNRLRTFFKYCLRKKWIYEDPTEKVDKPAAEQAERRIFLPSEFADIVGAAESDLKTNPQREVVIDAYNLAVATGMRLSELCSRTWGDYDEKRNLIRVDTQPAAGFTCKTDGSRRNIPLFPRALQVLDRRRELRISEDPSEPILLSPRPQVGSPFVYGDWVSRCFTEHRKDSGLPEGTMHDLRHTFTTYALALGIPESKVMKMTGHVKFDTVARYTHIVDELLQEAPANALAQFLPGYESERKPRLLRRIAAFMAGEECEEEPSVLE